MQTPAGTECPHYYADFQRGRHRQECRLIDRTPNGGRWAPDLCSRCPVPRIVLANACPHMILEGRVRAGILGFGRRVEVNASCAKSLETGFAPEIGCSECHQDLDGIGGPWEVA
jgi:hypothetical protein